MHIRTWFPSNVRNLQSEYISLVRDCNVLLRKIRDEVNNQVGDGYGHPRYKESPDYKSGLDSNDVGLINMVQHILDEGVQSQEAADMMFKGELRREREYASRGGPRLHVAAEVMESWIKKRIVEDEKRTSILTRKPGTAAITAWTNDDLDRHVLDVYV